MPAHRDLSGQTFHGVRVIAVSHVNKKSAYFYWCLCRCGDEFVAEGYKVRTGHTRSCGCVLRERDHGLVNTPEYRAWASMKRRCFNPRAAHYADYGGRGITVCERWLNFKHFYADMGRKPSAAHTLDRVNNDGNYSSDNCRWATRVEQANNRRRRRWKRAPTHRSQSLPSSPSHRIPPSSASS